MQILASGEEVDGLRSWRRTLGPIPPITVANPNLKLIERLTYREGRDESDPDLDLSEQSSGLENLGQDFWLAFQALDRAELFEETLAHLAAQGGTVTRKALAQALPPTHDLETLFYWRAMARESGIEVGEDCESIDLQEAEEGWFRFHVLMTALTFAHAKGLNAETLG